MRLRFRLIKFKFFCFISCSVIVYIILMYNFFDPNVVTQKVRVDFKYIVVHFDLKGAPPKIEYLESLLKPLKRYGVNGVLMEYEDMFPYVGNLVNLSSRNRYQRNELKKFLITAMKNEIEVIPLVQTFGHLEHALKLDEFKHLREVNEFPDSICPSNPESITLIKDMLEQVITFHNNVTPLRRIHIGCDGVHHIKKCEKCVARATTNEDIFSQHVLSIKNIIQTYNSSISVLFWDDIIRMPLLTQFKQKVFESLRELEPVYWDYSIDSASVSFINLHVYHSTFNSVWISTAYKGADGHQSTLPIYLNRVLNHYSWLSILAEYTYKPETKVSFEGILLTGWSRYSHMDPLCELLPPALPSLLMSLILIRRFWTGIPLYDNYKEFPLFFDKYLVDDVALELNCNKDFFNFYHFDDGIITCAAYKNELVRLLKQYQHFVRNVQVYSTSELSTNSSFEYYIKIKRFNMININTRLAWYKKILAETVTWKKNMQKAMAKYYEKHVIDEYVGYKIYAIVKNLNNGIKLMEEYEKIRTWDRGPQTFLDLKDME